MADHEIHNNENTQANRHTLLSSGSLREAFLDWLSEEHSQNLDLDVLVNSFDSISEYILRKKIYKVNLWSVSQHSVFQSLYNKISSNKWLKIFNRTTYKVFLTAGQLYLKFLEDKPYAIKMDLPKEINEVENNESSIPQDTAALALTEKHESMKLFVDFAHPELCAKTRPVNCFINGQAVIPEKQNWTSLLIAITERFIAEDNPNLSDLENKSLYGSKVFFMPRKTDFRAYHKLSNGKWIYTNYNPQIIVKIIGKLCQHCQISLSNVVISYLPKDSLIESSIRPNIHMVEASATSFKTILEPTLAKRITEIISTYFPNGFRIDSPIELMRFRHFAGEEIDNKIPSNDEELKRAIASCGTIFGGKIYVIDNEIESSIQKNVDLAFSEGAEIIFYSSFYKQHEEWLFPGSVISEEMLKNILMKLYPEYTHKVNYLSPKHENGTELDKIKNEIMRVWGKDVIMNYQQLATRLPYIPIEKIKYVLAHDESFIWNSKEVYSHVDMVDITKEECATIAEYVEESCRKNGYAPFSGIPLGEIEERNYELTSTAIYNAVFRIVLVDKYDRRGKIIIPKGDTLNPLSIIKKYCSTLDKCSLQDLLNFHRELAGETRNRSIPMEAAYSVMVRTNKNSFVAEKYVHFDTAEIDSILDLIVTGEYIPLKSITTFAAFPHCGYSWNLFLLESYCRRFSDRFRFDTPSVNSRNAGAIIRKSCSLKYVEVMADAVAKSGVALDKKTVSKFLYKSGYIGRSTTAKTTEIIEKAKTIRERRN